VLGAGLLLLAACGSSGSDSAGTTTTTAKPLTAADRRIGQAALLRDADAPGSQQVSPQTSVLADLADTGEPACAAYVNGQPHRLGTGRAAGLQRGATIVDSSTALYADAAAAQAETALFRAPAMTGCLKGVSSSAGATIDVTPVPLDGLGDEAVGYRIARAPSNSPPSNRKRLIGSGGRISRWES